MRTIVHYKSISSYLPITENWIYENMKNLKMYNHIVYARKIENLDIYGDKVNKIRILRLRNLMDPLTFFNKVCHRICGFYFPELFYFLKDNPDLIHAHFGPSGYECLKLKNILKLPLITSFYGFDLSFLPKQEPKWKEKYKKLFCEGDIFLVEGNYMKKSLVNLGCSPKKVIVQHLGVDTDNIKFMPRKIEPGGEVKILISATFEEKKGIVYALEAFAKVRNIKKNLFMTIIGDSYPGGPLDIKQQILTIIDKYNLKNFVNMMGYQPHSVFLNELYKNHIFIHPSICAMDGDNEGGAPVSIIEASASGMPVLSTWHCDIPEVIIDGKSGFLVKERDSDALAEKLNYIIENQDLLQKMGAFGRRHIEKNYDIKETSKNLDNIYKKILK